MKAEEHYRVDNFRSGDAGAVLDIWRACFPGRFLDARGLRGYTCDRPGFPAGSALVARAENGRPAAFALGTDQRIPEVGADELPGCVAVVMVHPEHRRRGLGGRLLRESEAFLAARGHRTFRAGYPTWIQGTILSTIGVNARWLEAAWFFEHYGYRVTGAFNSAVVGLGNFRLPEKVLQAERRAAALGIRTERLTAAGRAPFLALLEREFEGSWHRNFSRRIAENTLDWRNVVILSRADSIIGFVGPFHVSEDGIAAMGIGIGVAAEWRGRGLGDVLLYRGLEAMKDAGGRSCLLYGMGPKRFYENAGFRLADLWLMMSR